MFPVILIAILITGIIVFAMYIRRNPFDEVPRKEKPDDCDEQCGTCADLCAASRVLNAEVAEVGDFGDDNLDRFAGKGDGDYSDAQVDEFSEVLESLKPEEVASWLESLRRRGIRLPSSLRDEALMLVGDN